MKYHLHKNGNIYFLNIVHERRYINTVEVIEIWKCNQVQKVVEFYLTRNEDNLTLGRFSIEVPFEFKDYLSLSLGTDKETDRFVFIPRKLWQKSNEIKEGEVDVVD